MNEWISVEDKLPDWGTIVLVSVGHVGLVTIGMFSKDYKEESWLIALLVGWEKSAYPVTHWMPLPNPPSPIADDPSSHTITDDEAGRPDGLSR